MKKELENKDFLRINKDGLSLSLSIQPQAKKTALKEIKDTVLRLSVAAAAVEGKANKVLIEYLSKELNCAKSSIAIVRGKNSRQKVVRFFGEVAELKQKLQNWLSCQ